VAIRQASHLGGRVASLLVGLQVYLAASLLASQVLNLMVSRARSHQDSQAVGPLVNQRANLLDDPLVNQVGNLQVSLRVRLSEDRRVSLVVNQLDNHPDSQVVNPPPNRQGDRLANRLQARLLIDLHLHPDRLLWSRPSLLPRFQLVNQPPCHQRSLAVCLQDNHHRDLLSCHQRSLVDRLQDSPLNRPL
jgi:hypothetical protein